MAKALVSTLAAVVLASSLLTGCGGNPVMGLATTHSQSVSAKDYYSVSNAQRIASNGLYQYNDLRNQWISAYSDQQKDQIEDQMIVVLSGALGNVRQAVSADAGASGYDAAQVYNVADQAINQYEGLRQQWANTNDVNQQRWIANQMETVMTNALQQVLGVQAYNMSLNANTDLGATAPKTSGKRPTPPMVKLTKRAAKK